MHLPSGALLQGQKYKIIQKISQGNFGITYLAEQTSLDRKVCIKEFFFRGSCERTINGHVTVTTSGQEVAHSFRRKFLREARRLSQFDHPNIVKVIDVFEENGTAYMVMDYVEGETLQQLVDRKGKLTEKEALGYILPVCNALEVVHAKGLLHLDIKPSNFLVKKQENTPVLIDFGVSKFTEASGQDHSTTTPVALTKGYAPLEQYGQDINKLTNATDVYSLAATLYKLVTGVTPPEASVIIMDGIKPPKELAPAISEQLNSIIIKSLSLKSTDRVQSIRELKTDLQGISKQEIKEDTTGKTEVIVGDENTKQVDLAPTGNHGSNIIQTPEPEPKDDNSYNFWRSKTALIIYFILYAVFLFFFFWHISQTSNTVNEVAKTEVPPDNTVQSNENANLIDNILENEEIYVIVEEMPEFPGGELALRNNIASSIKYPTIAQDKGIQGQVFINFVVNKEGGISNVKVAKGIDPYLDNEALRVVKSLPKWKPGKHRGKLVNVSYTVPISFKLK